MLRAPERDGAKAGRRHDGRIAAGPTRCHRYRPRLEGGVRTAYPPSMDPRLAQDIRLRFELLLLPGLFG